MITAWIGRSQVYFNMDNEAAKVDYCGGLVDRKVAVVGMLNG